MTEFRVTFARTPWAHTTRRVMFVTADSAPEARRAVINRLERGEGIAEREWKIFDAEPVS